MILIININTIPLINIIIIINIILIIIATRVSWTGWQTMSALGRHHSHHYHHHYHQQHQHHPHHHHHQSLLDGVANNVGIGSLVVVVVASANVFVDILLLVGACCRTRLNRISKEAYPFFLQLYLFFFIQMLVASLADSLNAGIGCLRLPDR